MINLDFSTIALYILDFVLAGGLYLAGKVGQYALEKYHIQNLTQTLDNAINYGYQKAQDLVKTGLPSIQVKDTILNQGVQYVLTHVPDAINYLGYSPDELKEKLLARLPANN